MDGQSVARSVGLLVDLLVGGWVSQSRFLLCQNNLFYNNRTFKSFRVLLWKELSRDITKAKFRMVENITKK